MKRIISCDWGTSVLRVRLVDTNAVTVLAEVKSPGGISHTFESWKNSGKGEGDRLSFYQSVLDVQIKRLEGQPGSSLDGVPVVISGMASSSIGMVELPYKKIPVHLNEPDLNVKRIETTKEFKHSILLISGVRTIDDVMRGEETQLIGCLREGNKEEQLFIFPGTHSKHIIIKNGSLSEFKTYMTGEFFNLLSTQSILVSSVEPGSGLKDETNKKSFVEGVKASLRSGLLHNSFLVRTNHLFNKLTRKQNYYYLSGVVIGAEVGEIAKKNKLVTLVASGEMGELYTIAVRNRFSNNFRLSIEDPDQALVNGQIKILLQAEIF